MQIFIEQYIEKGNHIAADSWSSYYLLDLPNFGCIKYKHIYGYSDMTLD